MPERKKLRDIYKGPPGLSIKDRMRWLRENADPAEMQEWREGAIQDLQPLLDHPAAVKVRRRSAKP